jgi:hypothetical protein
MSSHCSFELSVNVNDRTKAFRERLYEHLKDKYVAFLYDVSEYTIWICANDIAQDSGFFRFVYTSCNSECVHHDDFEFMWKGEAGRVIQKIGNLKSA